MIRFFTLSRLVLALSICAVLTQPVHAKDTSATAPQPSGMAEVAGLVERALVEPVADLERKARKGYASDKLVYGLALKAGRAGFGQDKNAQKWIKKARNSFERPSQGKSQNSQVIGNAAQPVRDLEKKNYAGGQAVNSAPIGGSSSQSYISPSFPAKMNPDIILVAEACVDALLMAPDTKANVYACGGEAEYQRLLGLMLKSAAGAAMREIVGFVDAALTGPMANLERRAKAGNGRDKLIYGLALKAGRMGSDGVKDADQWIEAARQYKRAFVGTGAAANVTIQEQQSIFNVRTPLPRGQTQYALDGGDAGLDPLWIDIATQCVVALDSAPGQPVNMSMCGGEAEYRRLLALMPKP